MTRDEIQRALRRIFKRHLGASPLVTQGLVPQDLPAGKLYEAFVLSKIVQELVLKEGYSLALVGGTIVRLKTSPGAINRSYPHIELRKRGQLEAELWTDVEFLSMSFCADGTRALTKGDFHELDILIVDAGSSGRPRHDQIWLGVECKNTGYGKSLLREILGVRRELSYLEDAKFTRFRYWPRSIVPANPPSCLLVYSSDEAVLDYAAPGAMFGIDFVHEPM